MKKPPLFILVWEFIKKHRMFGQNSKALIAFSAGIDSVVLTTLLKEIQTNICPELKLHLAHLNHLLRGEESYRDEVFAQNFAKEFDIPIITNRIDIANLSKGNNIESTAREMRYKFLQSTAQMVEASVILTAHNMNDQAETFLMRLIRGAGITGLTGIRPLLIMTKQNLSSDQAITVPIARPLLNTRRDEIEEYLKEKQLNACIDSSNFSTKFTRNKIRLEILPEILKINPKAIEAISHTSNMLRGWQEILVDKKEVEITNNEIKIPIESLINLPQILRHQQLRDYIEKLRGKIERLTAKHILSADSLILEGKSGKKVMLPNNLEVAREFNYIIIRSATNLVSSILDQDDKINSFYLEINNNWTGKLFIISYEEVKTLNLNNYPKDMAVVVDPDKIGDTLRVRFRVPGDKYVPIGHQKADKLKSLMIKERIALSERSLWPIVTTFENEIIWAPRLALAARFAANSKSSRFAIISAK